MADDTETFGVNQKKPFQLANISQFSQGEGGGTGVGGGLSLANPDTTSLQNFGAAGTPQSTQQSSGGGVDMKGIANIASSAVQSIGQSNANDAMAGYNKQAGTAAQMDKYWFSPDNDVEPKLSEYLKAQPSATEALSKSTWLGGSTGKNDAEAILLNPASYLDKAGVTEKGEGAYVGEEAIQGAVNGFSSGGGWGALAGGVIGAIKAFFAWGSASDADKARTEDFNRQYKIWQEQRKKRIEATRLALMDRTAKKSERDAADSFTESERVTASKKAQMMNLIQLAMKNQGNPYQIATVPQRN